MKVTRTGVLKSAAAAAAGLFAGAAATLAFSCLTRPRPSANVVLIVVDALRPDHLGCYGYQRPTSPNIDALAADSAVFLRNKAQASLTVPSMSSLFASRLLLTHFIPPGVPSLPEILKSSGYRTIAVQTNPWLDQKRGFTRGFDSYRYLVPQGTKETLLDWHRKTYTASNPFYTDAAAVCRAVKEALDSAVAPLATSPPNSAAGPIKSPLPAPFFLYVHYMDVHGPYIPKDPYDVFSSAPSSFEDKLSVSRKFVSTGLQGDPRDAARLRDAAIDLYDGEIREVDDSIGHVLRALKDMGLYDAAMIVLTSDHGEAFGEHGQVQHGGNLFETQLHTPLIVKFPGRRAKLETKTLTRHLDVVPTILRECGFRRRHLAGFGLRGRPLQDVSPDSCELSRAALVMGSQASSNSFFAVEKDGFKLLVHKADEDGRTSERTMLFNLWNDPAETTDLFASHPQKVADLLPDLPVTGPLKITAHELTMPVSQEQKRRLQAVGYLQ